MSSFTMSRGDPIEQIIAEAKTWSPSHQGAQLNLFALVDAGQDKNAWRRLTMVGTQTLPLLDTQGTAAESFSPHLVALGRVLDLSAGGVKDVLSRPHSTSAFTLICSVATAPDLQRHFAHFVDVRLSGDMEMLLAFWDPAILGTLVGQKDDDSLHVPGPVLEADELRAFLSPLAFWWYCDRESRWHSLDIPASATLAQPKRVFSLTQQQEDLLVEASVPDQILYHLELNQPHLFDTDKTHAMRYGFVKAVLGPARQLGLTGMRDLVNFNALCLIYRRRLQTDELIARLLDQVQKKAITLDQAMSLMPD